MNEKKGNLKQPWVDPDDAPELDADFFARADLYDGSTLIRRGRPRSDITKVALTVRYDRDVVEAFRAIGAGWQTKMNDVLRNWVKRHGRLPR